MLLVSTLLHARWYDGFEEIYTSSEMVFCHNGMLGFRSKYRPVMKTNLTATGYIKFDSASAQKVKFRSSKKKGSDGRYLITYEPANKSEWIRLLKKSNELTFAYDKGDGLHRKRISLTGFTKAYDKSCTKK